MYLFTANFTKTQCDEENYEKNTTKVIGDWQIGCKDIKMRMVNLYYSDNYTDCTFLVGGEQLVSAHKVVLASASPVFAAMFYGGMPENGGPIHVDDIEADTFNEMLRYIYTDNTDIISINDACSLYYAAKKYMLLHLKTECLEYLLNNLTATDCCMAYEFAQMFDENKLLSACEEVMKTKTKEVLASTSFLEASLKTVHFIYSMNDLAIHSESELFEALERYVKYIDKCEDSPYSSLNICGSSRNKEAAITQTRTEIGDGPVKDDYEKNLNGFIKDPVDCVPGTKPELEKKNVMEAAFKEGEETSDATVKDSKAEISEKLTPRHVLKLIRFLTMSAEEFSNLPAASSLLTQEEMLSILMNIINRSKSKVPMPEGFSDLLDKRSIKDDPETRTVMKVRFTVPDCEYLEKGDVISFPQVHGARCSWKLNLTLHGNNNCDIYVFGTGPENYKFSLKLCVFTKKGAEKCFEFDYNRNPNENNLTESLLWDELLKNYLDDGALNFEVEFKPVLPEGGGGGEK